LNLYVDIGNSRIRLAGDNLGVDHVTAFYYTPETLPVLFDTHCRIYPPPDRVLVSNVAGTKVAELFTSQCVSAWSKEPEYIMVSRKSCGVINAYTDISQLGVDRWLSVIAAWNKYKSNLCVIDCGSAVTADIVAADGQHLGGYIIPGRYMMEQALVNNTGRIVIRGDNKFTGRAGRSTEECVYNGTILAIISFIEHVIDAVNKHQNDEYVCILTGGGAEAIMKLMKIHYLHEPLLVLEGIRLAGGS